MGKRKVKLTPSLRMTDKIEYKSHSVLSKAIIQKATGTITVSSVDTGEGFHENTAPFDTFIQVIDGKAEIVIEGESKLLETGDGIIVPANQSSSIRAKEPFKMISTIIKSGYE